MNLLLGVKVCCELVAGDGEGADLLVDDGGDATLPNGEYSLGCELECAFGREHSAGSCSVKVWWRQLAGLGRWMNCIEEWLL